VILGCGVDLIEVGRIERELTRRGQDPFDDLFTPDELAWCLACRRPADGYALGFAAKEAIVKALGTGLVGRMAWTDMRIDWSGAKPAVSLAGETAAAAEAMGVSDVHLTVALRRGVRGRPKLAPTSEDAEDARQTWDPASAGSGATAQAAAWVVLVGRARTEGS
jgi:holo-[acyl-carrier protein] synthase